MRMVVSMGIVAMTMSSSVRMTMSTTTVGMPMMISSIKLTPVYEMAIRVANLYAHRLFIMRMGMIVSSPAAVAMTVMEGKNT